MIAVLGATGNVGTHVGASLLSYEEEVFAVVRDPARLTVPLNYAVADLGDEGSLREAFGGATKLFLITPHGPKQDLYERAAVDAALAAGVRRIVKVSGGAPSLGPNAPTPTGVAHWRSEQRIESTGLDFCFLRPSFMMQNLLEAVAPLTAKLGILAAPFGRGQISMVDARDVAACAVVALTAEQSPDDAWQLTGPRAVSFADVADILGVPYFSVPRSIAERALRRRGLDDWEIDHSLRMTAYFAAGSDAAVTPTVRRVTGAPPRSIEDFLSENGDAFGGTAGSRIPTMLARLTSPLASLKGN
jgi:uncharacterized protein YbjT (DUF2867 family)